MLNINKLRIPLKNSTCKRKVNPNKYRLKGMITKGATANKINRADRIDKVEYFCLEKINTNSWFDLKETIL